MSQAVLHPALVEIADEIDAVGQRLRLYRMVRGAICWVLLALLLTASAVLGAHLVREGPATLLIGIAWIVLLAIGAAWWIGRPVFMRPLALHVARLIETRVDGLHTGLTNSLL